MSHCILRSKRCQVIGGFVALVVMAVATTSSHAGTMLDNSGVTATASSVGGTQTLPPETIDGIAGFSGNGWVSGTGDLANEWIQWDLGASYGLDRIHVWNYNRFDVSNTQRGIQQLDIYLSNVAAPGDPEGAGSGNWTLFAENVVFPIANMSAGYPGFDLETEIATELSATPVRWVRFEIDSNHGGNADALTEITFYIPTPGSLSMAVGLMGLTALRRRRARRA